MKSIGKSHHQAQQDSEVEHFTNVWDCAGAKSFGRGRQSDLKTHPTVKPPNGSSIKPFLSGGRPKRKSPSSIHEAILAGLQKTVTVKVSGQPQRMTQAELITTQLLARASAADSKATQILMSSELSATNANPLSELNGAAEETSKRLHMIQERRRKRACSHEEGGDLTKAHDETEENDA